MTRRTRLALKPTGFTLTELLVVIGIIAVLIGLLVAGIPRIRRAAQTAATNAQLVTIANGIQQYYNDFHSYPGPLANNQLAGWSWMGTFAFNDPTYGAVGLELKSNNTYAPFPQPSQITGSENLVLGLVGGLATEIVGGPYPGGTFHFVYDPTRIFSDPITPAPKGAMSLNVARPKVWSSYLQVRSGDISHPDFANQTSKGLFLDNANRVASDSVIPEFVDQYSTQQMPILYLRAYVSGTGIVSYLNPGTDANSPSNPVTGADDQGALLDANNVPVTCQYDIAPILPYTRPNSNGGMIGTDLSNPKKDHHGLQGIGTWQYLITTGFDKNVGNGKNALAYFKDPNNNLDPADLTGKNITGHARQKDAFILISAGPDGVYGTLDDVIYPGSLNP